MIFIWESIKNKTIHNHTERILSNDLNHFSEWKVATNAKIVN